MHFSPNDLLGVSSQASKVRRLDDELPERVLTSERLMDVGGIIPALVISPLTLVAIFIIEQAFLHHGSNIAGLSKPFFR